MLLIKEIKKKDSDLCFDLDSNTISLWSKKQWDNEFKKKGIKVFGLLLSDLVIGICVVQVVIDEAQINYFAIKKSFQRQGYGSALMKYLLRECEKFKIKKLLLEVSQSNLVAEKFYSQFDFFTVGIRKKYYRDGCSAFLKEKKL